MPAPTPTPTTVDGDLADRADVDADGRRRRRQQNREAVLAALVELFAEGNYQPGAADVAERAGLSPRSLFRYFDDVDDLHRAAIERHLAGMAPLLVLDVGPGDPLADRIDGIVAQRLRLHEATGPTARVARMAAHRLPVVAAQLAERRSLLRGQVAELFAAELAGERAALLPAVDALLAFETHELLRGDQRLDRAAATTCLTAALTALLTPR